MQPFIEACVHTHVSTVNHTTSVESLWKDCFAVLHIAIVTAIPCYYFDILCSLNVMVALAECISVTCLGYEWMVVMDGCDGL